VDKETYFYGNKMQIFLQNTSAFGSHFGRFYLRYSSSFCKNIKDK